ncbi:YraN family protein [Sphingobacterium spiritivorum]|uniref:YraN family protein n=1 Tax=Sphingobacterium spiritivorum TaxID=258 RepID=UPI003DA561DA
MAKHLEQGKKGEQMALSHLTALRYQILALNWRTGKLEVDILAYDGDILVFVEVKTRSSIAHGEPADFVDIQKQRKLIRAARACVEERGHQGDIRFDIVSVYLGEPAYIHLIKDAFWSE